MASSAPEPELSLEGELPDAAIEYLARLLIELAQIENVTDGIGSEGEARA